MGNISAWSLFLVVSLLAVKVRSQGEFDLADALDSDSKKSAATPKPVPSGGGGGPVLDLDFEPEVKITTTKSPPKTTKAPLKPKPKPDDTQADLDFGASLRPGLLPRATKGPRIPPKPQSASDGFDLADALDPNNDIGGKDKNKGQGGSFSDDDLVGVSKDDSYKPDKGKGGRGGGQSADENTYDTDTMAESGTIAGIVSAVGVALVGAITSYISYQKKKLCFGIQQSLQGDLVKTENPDAVVATEPQVQQTLLEPQNAEPPSEENVV